MRRIATIVALTVPGLLAAGVGAPTALAADGCSNAAVRAQQQSQHLPNCMAYERVSPLDKNGAVPLTKVAITADGGRVLFGMNSGSGDTAGFLTGNYRATRTDAGWTFNSLTPPFNDVPPILVDSAEVAGASADLERVVLQTRYPVAGNDRARAANGNGYYDLYLREPDGGFTWLVPDPSVPNTAPGDVTYLGGSADLGRVVLSTTRPFDARVTTTTVQHVYVWNGTAATLATVLPDGNLPSVLPPGTDFAPTRAVSADGRRVAFTVGDDGAPRVYVRFNADDPATAHTREVAVGPNGEACGNGSDSPFVGMSADGRKLIFACRNAILPGAPALGVYVRDLDGGSAAVRLLGEGTSPRILAANDDYSRVYMTGFGLGLGSLALIRDGVPEAALPTAVASGTQSLLFRVVASADGEYLAVQSAHDFGLPGVDIGTPDDMQVYLYSARTGETRCVSCRQDGSPTDGEATLAPFVGNVWTADSITPVAPNGALGFTSTVGLDPRDTNGTDDAYAWIDGRQVLLSGGRNRDPSVLQGVSADGRSFFVGTPDRLTGDDDDDGYDIYVAREGGGFLLPDAPPGCTSGCQAPAPERPGVPAIGSTGVLGRGNLVEETTAPVKRATASLSASRSVRGTSVRVRVKVSRAGTVRVSGVGLRRATVKAKKAGTYRVTVRLSAHGTKQQRRRGRFVTRITARFAPESGAAAQARRTITFAAAGKGGR